MDINRTAAIEVLTHQLTNGISDRMIDLANDTHSVTSEPAIQTHACVLNGVINMDNALVGLS